MNFLRHRAVRGRAVGHLPMTSLIDVVFLLLVFFMVTASMSRSESELASALRASDRGSGAAADLQPQIVDVEQTGGVARFRIGQRVLGTQADLRDVLASLPKDQGVFVRVADEAPVWATAAALQACKDAGFVRITYVPGS